MLTCIIKKMLRLGCEAVAFNLFLDCELGSAIFLASLVLGCSIWELLGKNNIFEFVDD